MSLSTESIDVAGVKIEAVMAGSGRPLLFLHGGLGLEGASAALALLAERWRLIAPAHPGFGRSEWPREFRAVSDLAYFYLDFADQLELDDAVLVGSCFGGWLAAEVLIRSTHRFGHLVLAGALGVKFGDHLTRDIADIHGAPQAEVDRLLFHDPTLVKRDPTKLSDEELTAIARNREAFAYFGWKPYMHNPALKRWLHRIDIPALLVWGAKDGFVAPDYGRAYTDAIPGARLEVIDHAGHYPHIEQPEAFAARIAEFVDAAG